MEQDLTEVKLGYIILLQKSNNYIRYYRFKIENKQWNQAIYLPYQNNQTYVYIHESKVPKEIKYKVKEVLKDYKL